MVRLKCESTTGETIFDMWSQFHYGSIEITNWCREVGERPLISSQFHYGSIEIDRKQKFPANTKMSQFHYGSIEIINLFI